MTNLVLTVRQPYSSAILQTLGMKDIENRPMRTRIRGRIGIHAGKQWHADATESDKKLPRGEILGTVQLVGCHPAGSADCYDAECYSNVWAQFPSGENTIWHWEFDHPRRFVTPIKANGALGFWRPGPSVDHLMEIAEVAE